MKKISPIQLNYFVEKFKTTVLEKKELDEYEDFFCLIDQTEKSASCAFFWYITDFRKMAIVKASDNLSQLSIYTNDELYRLGPEELNDQYHPDDRYYTIAAFDFLLTTYLKLDEAERKATKFNVYTRFLNSCHIYRWVMMHVPAVHINSANEIESILVIIFDLSHLNLTAPPLITLINCKDKKVQYFKHIYNEITKADVNLPKITKREKEILYLMIKGNNTPEIAQKLFLSYHTVENHKRNLRKKSNTKTSSELIAFIIVHNLIFID